MRGTRTRGQFVFSPFHTRWLLMKTNLLLSWGATHVVRKVQNVSALSPGQFIFLNFNRRLDRNGEFKFDNDFLFN